MRAAIYSELIDSGTLPLVSTHSFPGISNVDFNLHSCNTQSPIHFHPDRARTYGFLDVHFLGAPFSLLPHLHFRFRKFLRVFGGATLRIAVNLNTGIRGCSQSQY